MAKKKSSQKIEEKTKELQEICSQSKEIEEAYDKELAENPKYSLEPDPLGNYRMSQSQKEFIKQYVQFRNVSTAAALCDIDPDVAKTYLASFNTQEEIRRINMAMCQRQFRAKMMSLDQIGGYLTSMLTGEGRAFADTLKPSEQLNVIKMLIDLNTLKLESLRDPSQITAINIETEIKNLSIGTIKDLLNTKKKKPDIIREVEDDPDLSPEESAYLHSLPAEDLLQIIEKKHKEES